MAGTVTGPLGVGPVGLGGARWSLVRRPDVWRATATVRAALEAGVTLFDTAHAYTTPDAPPGRASHNEELLARALGSDRHRVLVATKGGHHREGDRFPVDARPHLLRRQCELSLRALDVERIDLYQLHFPDPRVPLVESVGALAALRDEGKIARVGLCNVDLDQLREARSVTPVASVQNRMSAVRPEDPELLEYCAAEGIAYLAASPLGGPDGVRSLGPAFRAVAADRGVSVHRVALAWALARPGPVTALVGAGRPETLDDCLAAARLRLSPDELSVLDRG